MQINLNENEIMLLGTACVCFSIVFMGIFITVYVCRFIKKNVIGITYDEKIKQLQTNIDMKIDEMKNEMSYVDMYDKSSDAESSIENDEIIKISNGEQNLFEEIINEYLT